MPYTPEQKKFAKARTNNKSMNTHEGFDRLKTFQDSLDIVKKSDKEKKKQKLSNMWKELMGRPIKGGPSSDGKKYKGSIG